MIDISLLLFALAGVIFGVIAGLVPGVGLTAMMTMVGFLFVTNNAIDILIFYIGMLCASQYAGSMLAISFGIPGESSSVPAVREGHVLFKQGKGSLAIGTTAIGSFLGSVVSVAIFVLILFMLKDLLLLWNNSVQVVVLTAALLMIMLTSNNRWYISLIFVLLGMHFGLTGINYAVGFEWATFDQMWLYNGIPLIPFLMGVFVLPEVINGIKSMSTNTTSQCYYSIDVKQNLTEIVKHKWVILYSSTIGFVSGLMPNLTTRLASNLSWMAQKTIVQRTKQYKVGDISCLISAETSNNAASFSVLIPLIILGMPITPSEFIVFEYMSSAITAVDVEFVMNHAVEILTVFFLVNIACLMLAWPLANLVLKTYQIPKLMLVVISAGLIVFPVIFEGIQQGLVTLYLILFVFFAIMGLVLKKTDTVPLVFGFLISVMFVESYWIFFQKFF